MFTTLQEQEEETWNVQSCTLMYNMSS